MIKEAKELSKLAKNPPKTNKDVRALHRNLERLKKKLGTPKTVMAHLPAGVRNPSLSYPRNTLKTGGKV